MHAYRIMCILRVEAPGGGGVLASGGGWRSDGGEGWWWLRPEGGRAVKLIDDVTGK